MLDFTVCWYENKEMTGNEGWHAAIVLSHMQSKPEMSQFIV